MEFQVVFGETDIASLADAGLDDDDDKPDISIVSYCNEEDIQCKICALYLLSWLEQVNV